MRRLLLALALAIACLAVLIVPARFHSYVAGGSDSYCYVHQAERWASGRLLMSEPLAVGAPWPDAALTFAPAGHRPSPTVAGALVPICPSGLSMLMAPFLLAGGRAAMFLVFPLCALALVLGTFALGRHVSDTVGAASALVMAASPIALYQLVQPMSDVPAAAFWTLALAAATSNRRALLAGACTSAAILIRPNLLPLGFLIGAYLLVRPDREWRERIRDAVVYAAGSAAGCFAVAAIQWHFFGSPLSSGYGGFDDIFALEHVGPNATRYLSWIVQSQTPLVLLALVSPLVLSRPFALLGLVWCAVTLGVYLPYLVFEDWSYVRFLLPAVPVLIVLTLGTLAELARRASTRWADGVVAVVAVLLVAAGVRTAASQRAFDLRELESVFPRSGEAIASRLPGNALVITSRYSGSVRYYGGRRTIVWDVLDPGSLDRVLSFARERGFVPYFLLDSGEETAFRQRFAGSASARLDWPPMIEIAPQVRVYSPDDRERFLRGDTRPTEYVK
jgi:hypothetical protein